MPLYWREGTPALICSCSAYFHDIIIIIIVCLYYVCVFVMFQTFACMYSILNIGRKAFYQNLIK